MLSGLTLKTPFVSSLVRLIDCTMPFVKDQKLFLSKYHSIHSNTLFFALQYFHFSKLKVFSNRLPLVCLSFRVMQVIPQQVAVFSFPHLLFRHSSSAFF